MNERARGLHKPSATRATPKRFCRDIFVISHSLSDKNVAGLILPRKNTPELFDSKVRVPSAGGVFIGKRELSMARVARAAASLQTILSRGLSLKTNLSRREGGWPNVNKR